MITRSFNWLDDRTGYRRWLAPITRRVLPNGPRWAYATASCVLWLLVVEIVTGLLLMTTYSPSTTSAWASVHYLEQMSGGAFIRGVHYYAAQALLVMFGVHLIRVLLAAAFRAPRELVWITGLLLLPLMLVWAITGNPLSGSQKGASQIEVEANIIGSTPVVGPPVRQILLGGDEVGHLTITHLHFLHVALMPLLAMVLLVIHIGQVYRHGATAGEPTTGGGHATPYWPHQTARNMIVFGAVFAAVAAAAWYWGAPLDAPADVDLPHTPRPEWYFLFLFELRRYFTGEWEFVATIIIPAAVLLLLLAMPLFDRAMSERASRVTRFAIVFAGLLAWGGLTAASVLRDRDDGEFQAAQRETEELAQRARYLADTGDIPPAGAVALLRSDTLTQGKRLFQQHCASCHSHADAAGAGVVAAEPSAPNLYGFATPEWIAGFLSPERIASSDFFGGTKHKAGDMAEFVKGMREETSEEEALNVARALSLAAELPHAEPIDAAAPGVAAGLKFLRDDGTGCAQCHRVEEEGTGGNGPDLHRYGSRAWLIDFLSDPGHERFYGGTNDRMPAYAKPKQDPATHILSRGELETLADWLRGDWRR